MENLDEETIYNASLIIEPREARDNSHAGKKGSITSDRMTPSDRMTLSNSVDSPTIGSASRSSPHGSTNSSVDEAYSRTDSNSSRSSHSSQNIFINAAMSGSAENMRLLSQKKLNKFFGEDDSAFNFYVKYTHGTNEAPKTILDDVDVQNNGQRLKQPQQVTTSVDMTPDQLEEYRRYQQLRYQQQGIPEDQQPPPNLENDGWI